MPRKEVTTMPLYEWDQLTELQKNIILNFYKQDEWVNLKLEVKTRFTDFALIDDVLSVPKIGRELSTHRKWTLPDLDDEALADLP